jgi:hypothetical protein
VSGQAKRWASLVALTVHLFVVAYEEPEESRNLMPAGAEPR